MDAIKSVLLSVFLSISYQVWAFESDAEFGTNGEVEVHYQEGEYFSRAYGMYRLQDGKIFAFGDYQMSQEGKVLPGLTRLNSDGTPDTSFHLDQKFMKEAAIIKKIAPAADNKWILAATEIVIPEDGGDWWAKLVVSRILDNGELDTTFGDNGFFRKNFCITDVYVDSQQRIYLVGSTNFWKPVVVIRLLPDGSFDSSYGNGSPDGSVFSKVYTFAHSAYLDATDRLMIFGTGKNSSFWYVERYTPEGALDTTWGRNGIASAPVPGRHGTAHSLMFQDNGGVVISGFVYLTLEPPRKKRVELMRFDSSGEWDSGFGGEGKVGHGSTNHYIAVSERLWQVSQERILFADTFTGNNDGMRLLLWESDGTPVSSFGANGVLELPELDFQASLMQPDDKLVVVTYDYQAKNPTLKRFKLGI